MLISNITTSVNPRELRGLEIAQTRRITQAPNGWIVPSQVGKGRYIVSLSLDYCTCPDFELRRLPCKHVFAVRLFLQENQEPPKPDPSRSNLEPVTKRKRATYRQNWPAYNAAQVHEKARLMGLLHDLCRGIQEPVQTFGRPRLPLADRVFSIAFKVYSTFSGRRFMCDLYDAWAREYISKVPHYNSVFNYLDTPEMTPILQSLIVESSLPLRAIETDFAVDSSGFGTSIWTLGQMA